VAGFAAKQVQAGLAQSCGFGLGWSGQVDGTVWVVGVAIVAQRPNGLKTRKTRSARAKLFTEVSLLIEPSSLTVAIAMPEPQDS
jgi:hypothetical protein